MAVHGEPGKKKGDITMAQKPKPVDWKKKGLADPAIQEDLVKEMQRLIKAKKLPFELTRKPTAPSVADSCTHCNWCPCMFIG
jgi:hypothetical protein